MLPPQIFQYLLTVSAVRTEPRFNLGVIELEG
jgi:hypothetical protein